MPEPLLTMHLFSAWVDVPCKRFWLLNKLFWFANPLLSHPLALKDNAEKLEALRLLCALLTDEHRLVLQDLLNLLHQIAIHANDVR